MPRAINRCSLIGADVMHAAKTRKGVTSKSSTLLRAHAVAAVAATAAITFESDRKLAFTSGLPPRNRADLFYVCNTTYFWDFCVDITFSRHRISAGPVKSRTWVIVFPLGLEVDRGTVRTPEVRHWKISVAATWTQHQLTVTSGCGTSFVWKI
jgi:hypothetical protein